MSDPAGFQRDLAAGVALFNEQRYFEAHEVWEDRWRLETGEARRLLHGLIQLAAALHQLVVLRSPVGFTRLIDKALRKLRPLGDRCCGIALAPLVVEAERWRARTKPGQRGEAPELDRSTFLRVAFERPP